MSASFSLILIAVGGYLAAHVAFGWIARRFMIISGAEYLLLGVLLGPKVTGLISASAFEGFGPLMTLALGWIGAVVGAQFYFPELVRLGARPYRIAFVEAVVTGIGVGAAMALVLAAAVPTTLGQVAYPAAVLAAIGVASSPTGIALVGQHLRRGRGLVEQLQVTSGIDALVAIVIVSVVVAMEHPAPVGLVRAPTATEWVVISIGMGCAGGALFHLFLGGEQAVDRLFIGLAGAIILTSGAAAYLGLSPLLPALLVGAILINTSENRALLRQALSSVERPIYFVLLIFAGAAWRPGALQLLIPILGFAVVRIAMKVTGAWVAGRTSGAPAHLSRNWGRALLGQGGLAVALGLSYLLVHPSAVADVVFTAALASVLLTDVTAARSAHTAVQDILAHDSARAPRPEPASTRQD